MAFKRRTLGSANTHTQLIQVTGSQKPDWKIEKFQIQQLIVQCNAISIPNSILTIWNQF